MPAILVIGDIMIDRFLFGDVLRLSQEAPVPVVKFRREEYRLGAAANVAANVATLGEPVTLIGIVGDDAPALNFYAMAETYKINRSVVVDPTIPTTQKLRIIGRSQQIVRVDTEKAPAILIDDVAKKAILEHAVIVFSDYGKGALRNVDQLIAFAKGRQRTVLVDPKGYDYARYRYADLVKPNVDEIREMIGGWTTEDELVSKVRVMRHSACIANVLLTRASDGMTLYGNETTSIKAVAQEVFDVTGAGDTVMAALAVELSRGKSLQEAAMIANYAAGVAVSKFGTHAVTKQELEGAMKCVR
jgi:rfaE bifunctional protein kinase chain/domain